MSSTHSTRSYSTKEVRRYGYFILGTFTRLRGERDDIPEGPPQYDSDGKNLIKPMDYLKNYTNETMGSEKSRWGSRNLVAWIVVGLISCQKGDSAPWACVRCINGGSGLCFTVRYTSTTTAQPRLTMVRLQKGISSFLPQWCRFNKGVGGARAV